MDTGYTDRVLYAEKVWEVAWRRGSLESNYSRSSVKAVRKNTARGWIIISGPSSMKWDELLHRLQRISSHIKPKSLESVRLYNGKVMLGQHSSSPEEELFKIISRASGLLEEKGVSGEVIATYYETIRKIEHSSGVAEEYKSACELYVFAEIVAGGKRSVGSVMYSWIWGPAALSGKELEKLVDRAVNRALAGLKAKQMSPLEWGRIDTVLSSEASAALLHEISHLLEADQPEHFRRNTRITSEDIIVRDDPYQPTSPASRAFDDEAVQTVRRTLVENGVVVDNLHTLETAYLENSKPGSAYGLFHKPKALHTNLVVEPGDWREREIIEETKRGVFIDSVISAEIRGNIITIIPETAWLIEKGEISKPVLLEKVKIPVPQGLYTISAIGKNLSRRISYEKRYVVSESAPWIRLQAYVS